MNIEPLLSRLPEKYSDADRNLILRAYRVAAEAHAPQKRASGEPYITHCIAVADILAGLKVPPAVVAAGLLHDTVEDTPITLNDIRGDFGDEVARLVDGVTKLTEMPRVSRGGEAVEENNNLHDITDTRHQILGRKTSLVNETLRKTFLAMGEDPRVPLIKLADRLHNMQTLSSLQEHKRRRIAQETLDIFAPMANRLGIWEFKWQLEDLAFRYVNPEMYKEVARKLEEKRTEREKKMEEIIKRVSAALQENHLEGNVSGRPKHIYSIYRKMMKKGVTFEQLNDIRGVRIQLKDKNDCYMVLGIIHSLWRPIPGEFDDYIGVPKDNFYRSLHTTVLYDDGRHLEFQIRTVEMHQEAEYGIAAHWRYKEGQAHDQEYQKRVSYIRQMIQEWREDSEDASDFVESMKSEVLQDRVYAFTPRGDVVDLPQGATPIDFAYFIHTEVGHCCRGAKVNGKLVPLDHPIKTGDQVEILTAKRGTPSRDWLNPNLGLVTTHRAREKIRHWFKVQDREYNITQGRAILDKELARLGVGEISIEKLARDFGLRTVEDLSFSIGAGDLPIGRIITHLAREEEKEPTKDDLIKPAENTSGTISVLGLRGVQTNVAKCCNPAPGDEIVGYITRGRGASVHRSDCPNILSMREPERIVKASWGTLNVTYPVSVRIRAFDREGIVKDVSSIIADEKINITDWDVKTNKDRTQAVLDVIMEVKDITQLSRVLTKIEKLPNIRDARRVTG
jgi:GTP diphosphokinase / guanosine-3',5'-bis(diphosphate) 3'-diphosphatase